MNDGTLSMGFGIGIDTGGWATHLVTITFDDGREYQFKATCIQDDEVDEDDEPLVIYKVEHGEKDYDTYIEITDDDTLTICIDGVYTIANIIDSNLDKDKYDMDFDCKEDGINIHVQCEFIMGQDENDIADIIHSYAFDSDGNEIEYDSDEDWEDDDLYDDDLDDDGDFYYDEDDLDDEDEL